MTKTEQTLSALKEKCADIKYGEWTVKLFIHEGEITGFDQEIAPLVRFRAVKEGGKR